MPEYTALQIAILTMPKEDLNDGCWDHSRLDRPPFEWAI